jgi:hypothetical protein
MTDLEQVLALLRIATNDATAARMIGCRIELIDEDHTTWCYVHTPSSPPTPPSPTSRAQ